jgi:hypothetical protein
MTIHKKYFCRASYRAATCPLLSLVKTEEEKSLKQCKKRNLHKQTMKSHCSLVNTEQFLWHRCEELVFLPYEEVCMIWTQYC